MFHLCSWLMILSTLLPRLGSWLIIFHNTILIRSTSTLRRWHHTLWKIITILQLNLVPLSRFTATAASRRQRRRPLVPSYGHISALGGVQLRASLFLLCLKAVILRCLLGILVWRTTEHVNAVSIPILGRLRVVVSSSCKTVNYKNKTKISKKEKRKKLTGSAIWSSDKLRFVTSALRIGRISTPGFFVADCSFFQISDITFKIFLIWIILIIIVLLLSLTQTHV